MNLRQCVWVLAVVLGTGITVGTVRAAAPQSSQDHAQTQDYSKNKNYQVGMRDGKDDKAHNRDHSKKRNFKKDEDQRAYESGYQQGHQGDQK
jgi:ribosome modulation factor